MSSSSVSLVLYGSGTSIRRKLLNYQKLRLTSAARARLNLTNAQGSPVDYVRYYGTQFVASMVFGGSFFGEFTLDTTTAATRTSTTLGFNVSVDAFSVGGSAAFEWNVQSSSSTLDLTSSVKCSGSFACSSALATTPEAMHDSYVAFAADLASGSSAAMPLYAETRRQVDSVMLQAALLDPRKNSTYFTRDMPTPPVLELYTETVLQAVRLSKELNRAKEWRVAVANSTLFDALTALETEVTAVIATMSTYDVDALLDMQAGLQQQQLSMGARVDSMVSAYTHLVTPFTTCHIELYDREDQLRETLRFGPSSNRSSLWPFIFSRAREDNTASIQPLKSGISLGCGEVVVGDADSFWCSNPECKGCKDIAYRDNLGVQPGEKARLPWDLENDVCGLWVKMPYLMEAA